METNENKLAEVKEIWTKPNVMVLLITENTLGEGGGGVDFGSELGS